MNCAAIAPSANARVVGRFTRPSLTSVQCTIVRTVSTPAKATLSRERILEAARALVEEEGQARLSMRRLGERLDVWPMALYHWFRDKDELLDALAAHASEAVGARGTDGPWQTRLKAL